MVTHRPPS